MWQQGSAYRILKQPLLPAITIVEAEVIETLHWTFSESTSILFHTWASRVLDSIARLPGHFIVAYNPQI